MLPARVSAGPDEEDGMTAKMLLAGCVAGMILTTCQTTAGQGDARKGQGDNYWQDFAKDKFSLGDLVKGDRLPATLKPSELPDGYKAYKIQSIGGNGFGDIFGSPFSLVMMGGMGSSRDAAMMELLDVLDLTWTRGEVIQLISQAGREDLDKLLKGVTAQPGGDWETYLVTYKADIGMGEMRAIGENPGKVSGVSLKLHLIKFKAISSVTPEPEFTKDRLVQALETSGAAIAKEPSDVDRAKRAAALSNVKQIDLGLIMYGGDNDDYLPFVQSTAEIKKDIAPYLKSDSLWDTLNPKSRFLFNMCLSGVSFTAIPDPAATPMIYESAPGADGTRVVGFVDGHAKRVSEAEWQGMAKYLKLKLPRRTTKPTPPARPDGRGNDTAPRSTPHYRS